MIVIPVDDAAEIARESMYRIQCGHSYDDESVCIDGDMMMAALEDVIIPQDPQEANGKSGTLVLALIGKSHFKLTYEKNVQWLGATKFWSLKGIGGQR